MFVHPIEKTSEVDLFALSSEGVTERLSSLIRQFDANKIHTGMVSFFDSKIIINKKLERLSFSIMPDLNDGNTMTTVERARENGYCSVTFHPYLQKIDKTRYQDVLKLARYAEKLGMFICICSAYGSQNIYNFFSLPLAVCLAETVRCPIVLIHAGGAKILDAMLIADAFSNVYLETSFSLPYWIGSSVEIDFAYAMRKLGPERRMFGSDSPFWDIRDALNCHLEFFVRHRFSFREIEQIMGGTAAELLGGIC